MINSAKIEFTLDLCTSQGYTYMIGQRTIKYKKNNFEISTFTTFEWGSWGTGNSKSEKSILYSLNIVIFIFGRLEVPQSNIKWRGFQIDFSSTLPNIIYIILVLHTYCSRVYSLISKESSHIFRWIIYKTQHNCEDKDVVEGL